MKDNTFAQDLLIPFYCDNCRNLVFLHKAHGSSNLMMLDYLNFFWKQHPCKYFRGESLLENETTQKLSELEWGVKEIPFAFKRERSLQIKQNKPISGVIVSVSAEEHNSLRVITPENSFIKLRTLFETGQLSAGMLIDLSDMTRIGPGKYRLSDLKQIVIPENLAVQANIPNEFYQLSASSSDQEQLESFINRLLKTLLKSRIHIHMITISPVVGSPPLYGRKISVYPVPDLIKKIENIVIPDSIQISVKQVGSKSFAESAMEKSTSPKLG